MRPTPFVVQHDWASALKGAQDFEGGAVKLPYEETLFEFQVSGHHICLWAAEGEPLQIIFARLNGAWLMCPSSHDLWTEQSDEPLFNFLGANVRAICIALDAGVAVADTLRADEKLNRARAKLGRLPLLDYHVVKLNRQTRAAPLPADPFDERAITRHRLHFVRGHWRHYQEHKTWIKWHLRGDPDLGFIDKHYRL